MDFEYNDAMLRLVDRFLNFITMYRLVLYGLLCMAAFALLFSVIGLLSERIVPLLLSLVIVVAACSVTNLLFSAFFKVPVNSESSFITALILFSLMSPVKSPTDALMLVLACVIAMGSKYFISPRGRHIFNPAAFAAVILGFTGSGAPVWWIGSAWMLPVTLVIAARTADRT